MRPIIFTLLICLLLSGCAARAPGEISPAETTASETSLATAAETLPSTSVTSASTSASTSALTTALTTTAPAETSAEEPTGQEYSDPGYPFSEPSDLDDEDFVYMYNIDENARPLAEVLLRDAADPEKKLYDFVADDFDLDGKYEAFAVLGRFTGYESAGDIYFVTENGAEKINDETYYLAPDRYPVFDMGDRKFYRVWHVFTTGESAYVYGVKDGKWYEQDISQRGQDLERVGLSDDFTIVNGSDYDMGYFAEEHATSGHTWKTYYLYWNGEEFREYGGIEITEEEFLSYENAGHFLELAEENGCFVSGILYRGNGLINLNMTKRDFYGNEDYYYFSLIPSDGGLEFLRTDYSVSSMLRGEDEFTANACPGIMKPAFLEDIADYPEKFVK